MVAANDDVDSAGQGLVILFSPTMTYWMLELLVIAPLMVMFLAAVLTVHVNWVLALESMSTYAHVSLPVRVN